MNILPVEASDVLNGYEEIAAFYRITVRQAKHRAAIGAIPTYKQGRIVCARRSSCLTAIAQAEARAAHRPKRDAGADAERVA